ncbi:MAG: TIGR04076 family protein, partial [Promethearchaeota archaeon]
SAGGEGKRLPSPAPGDLRITVERIEGRCLEGMCVGRTALLRGSSLYLPQPFCLYALQAALPLLPAMQRRLEPSDWMATENDVVCPDPLGNVILRIEKVGSD